MNVSRPCGFRWATSVIVLALVGMTTTVHAGKGLIADVTPIFRPGPYLSIATDPLHPQVVMVGTPDGWLLTSLDGAATADETHVIPPREYVAMALRGQGSRARQMRKARAQKLFMRLLIDGMPVVSWATWMSLDTPPTDISSAAIAGNAKMAIASQAGIYVSDALHGVWTRVIGGPKAHGHDIAGFSVAFNPKDPKHILAGTSDGLYVSKNGGELFSHHPDKKLKDENITQIQWDVNDGKRVIVMSADVVYLSNDGGETFQAVLQAGRDKVSFANLEITCLAVGEDGVWMGTNKGLKFTPNDGKEMTLLKDHAIAGLIPLGNNFALVATDEELAVIGVGEPKQVLMRVTPGDPFVKLVGSGQLAWLLTSTSIFRIGVPIEREAETDPKKAPRLDYTMRQVEKMVAGHVNIGRPQDTRLSNRWYANLVPQLMVQMSAGTLHSTGTTRDGTILPGRIASSTASSSAFCCGTAVGTNPEFLVMATWDLRSFLLGALGNISNPLNVIDQNLRGMQTDVMSQVRTRYRSIARLVELLKHPPLDESVTFFWKLRLKEHVAYLHALTGRNIVTYDGLEDD